tara:strand:- start:328 stop:519 length:192 start_codon:yes stop_codon:yes gene_type:complete
MKEKNLKNLENLISKLNNDRTWILKNIDKGKWPDLRIELATLEREISKFILRAKEYNSKNNEY